MHARSDENIAGDALSSTLGGFPHEPIRIEEGAKNRRELFRVLFVCRAPKVEIKEKSEIYTCPRRGGGALARDRRRMRSVPDRSVRWVTRQANPLKPDAQRFVSRQYPKGHKGVADHQVVRPVLSRHLSR